MCINAPQDCDPIGRQDVKAAVKVSYLSSHVGEELPRARELPAQALGSLASGKGWPKMAQNREQPCCHNTGPLCRKTRSH